MKGFFTTAFLILSTGGLQGATALVSLHVDLSAAGRGFLPDGNSGTFYLRSSPADLDFAGIQGIRDSLTPENSVSLGTFFVGQSLTVAPISFSLGNLEPILTDGLDHSLQLLLVSNQTFGSTVVVGQKKESEWFGLTGVSQLQGGSVVAAEFRVNEIRSQAYAFPNNLSALDVYYLDASVEIQVIPEPAGLTRIFAGLSCGAVALRRRKRAS